MHLRYLATSLAVLSSCRETFPSASIVTDLRVLAIVADPPEISPQQESLLSALVVEPDKRPFHSAWAACDPAILDLDDPERECAAEVSVTLPLDEEGRAIFSPTTLVKEFGYEAALENLTQDVSIDWPIVLRVRGDEKRITAIKRVTVSLSSTPNQNPVIEDLEDLSCFEIGENLLRPVVPIESLELADPKEIDPFAAHEEIRVRFYSDIGRFRDARVDVLWTEENVPELEEEGVWMLEDGDARGHLWTVADDHRSGLAYLSIVLEKCR